MTYLPMECFLGAPDKADKYIYNADRGGVGGGRGGVLIEGHNLHAILSRVGYVRHFGTFFVRCSGVREMLDVTLVSMGRPIKDILKRLPDISVLWYEPVGFEERRGLWWEFESLVSCGSCHLKKERKISFFPYEKNVPLKFSFLVKEKKKGKFRKKLMVKRENGIKVNCQNKKKVPIRISSKISRLSHADCCRNNREVGLAMMIKSFEK